MKRRLNILCILVVLLLLVPVWRSVYYLSLGVKSGLQAGMENRIESAKTLHNIKGIYLIHDDFLNYQDSVKNDKTGENVPVIHTQMGVVLPIDQSIWQISGNFLCTYIYLIAGAASIALFILIIISVNKSNIFTWKNVSRLRWLGSMLILTFAGDALPQIFNYISISGEFSLSGYSLSLNELLPVLTLSLGLVSYLFAEIFAIGIRMKEEQDLTI